jgi:hypothetical protein
MILVVYLGDISCFALRRVVDEIETAEDGRRRDGNAGGDEYREEEERD